MKPKYLLPTVLVGALYVATTACNLAAIPADLATLATQVQDDKDLIETLVHDLKSTPPTKGPAEDLQSVEDLYDEARATQQGYLSAVRIAVETRNKNADLGREADQAEVAAERFIEAAASILQQRESGGGPLQVTRRSRSSAVHAPSPSQRTIDLPRFSLPKIIETLPSNLTPLLPSRRSRPSQSSLMQNGTERSRARQ